MSLSPDMFQIGRKLNIKSYRGEEENFVGKIIEVRDIYSKPIQMKSVSRRSEINARSQYLIFVENKKENKIKSFYHEFIELEPECQMKPCSA